MTGLFDTEASHLDGLNAAQRDAVTHEGSPLIVLAGPGTGKTRVIVRRIAHAIRAREIDPGAILALTFTNKAAGEMRERLGDLLDPVTSERVHAHTFNGFGAMLLRRFSDLAGLPREPELIDSAQRMRMMRAIVRERRLFTDAEASGVDDAIRTAQRLIDAMTAAGLTAETALERVAARRADPEVSGLSGDERVAADNRIRRLSDASTLWSAFDAACRERGVLGFDHQIAWVNRLLRERETARAIVRRDYRVIVVDEFQDVNNAQIEMLSLIAPPSGDPGTGPDLCVVGDDDQAIYAFRGADDRAFEKFERRWSGARTVMLEENYRSASRVLDAAGAIIGAAHERFRADKIVRRAEGAGDEPGGAAVEGVRLEHFQQAGEVIASMIRADLETRDGARPGDHAVIARTWPEIGRVRATLEMEGIPCRAARERTPSDDPGVQDVLAWADLLLNGARAHAARRLLLRPPFATSVSWVNRAEGAFRADRSRAERHGDADTEFPGFCAWLRDNLERVGGDDRERAAAERFLRVWEGLRTVAATAPAHEVIAEIVRRADVVHAELLDGRARAGRVGAVVALLRFATERMPRLEEPGDLRAFRAYLDDLDESERSFRTPVPSHEEEAGAEDGDGDAVRLLTAHGAKGLEFDTVYLPRVETRFGFPSVREPPEEETPPGWLTGDTPTDIAGLQDEERRLFYVACTRARRRAVMLGVVPKKRPAKPNYFYELMEAGGVLTEREAGEVLGPHPRDGVDRAMPARASWSDAEAQRERLRDARRAARLDAASALDEASAAGGDGAALDMAGDRLRDAARRMAVIGAAQRGDGVPAWAGDGPLRALHASLAKADDASPPVVASSVLRPMTAPLELDYTRLNEWFRCPRCFAVRYQLGLPAPETAKTVVGKAVHEALEAFYRGVRRAGETGTHPPTLDDLLAMGRARFEAQWSPGEEIDRAQGERVLALLRQGHDALHADSLNPVAVEQKIRFRYAGPGGTHWFTAKIDRIDEDGGGYRVVDYKTGVPSKRLREVGKQDLQFGIYALAVRAFAACDPDALEGVLEGNAPVVAEDIDALERPAGVAEYWLLASGEVGRVSFDELAEHETKLRETIDGAIEGMLRGEYPRGKERDCRGLCTILDPGVDAG